MKQSAFVLRTILALIIIHRLYEHLQLWSSIYGGTYFLGTSPYNIITLAFYSGSLYGCFFPFKWLRIFYYQLWLISGSKLLWEIHYLRIAGTTYQDNTLNSTSYFISSAILNLLLCILIPLFLIQDRNNPDRPQKKIADHSFLGLNLGRIIGINCGLMAYSAAWYLVVNKFSVLGPHIYLSNIYFWLLYVTATYCSFYDVKWQKAIYLLLWFSVLYVAYLYIFIEDWKENPYRIHTYWFQHPLEFIILFAAPLYLWKDRHRPIQQPLSIT